MKIESLKADNILDKLKMARTGILLDHPFFGNIMFKLKFVAEDCKTLATDGVKVAYNPAFVESLTPPVLKAAIAHELFHAAMGHTWRGVGKDHVRWNHAVDYVTNAVLKNSGFVLGEGWLYNPMYDGKSAEEVYRILSEQKQNEPQTEQLPQSQSSQDTDQDNAQDCGPGEALPYPSSDPGEIARHEAEMKVTVAAAARAAKAAGMLPGALSDQVEEFLEPVVNWKEALSHYMTMTAKSDYSWQMPASRYLCHGLYLPALRSEELGDIVVVVDTSGSMLPWIENVFSEIAGICDQLKPKSVHVVCADTRVQSVETFEPGDDLRFTFKGGGGTKFSPALKWIEDEGINPLCVVYLTDLQGEFPSKEPDYPVIWATDSRHIKPPFGDVVLVQE